MRELDIERIALIGRAVSDPNRIVILLKLENGDMTTQEIMDSCPSGSASHTTT